MTYRDVSLAQGPPVLTKQAEFLHNEVHVSRNRKGVWVITCQLQKARKLMLPRNGSMAGLASEKGKSHPEAIRPAAPTFAHAERALMPAVSPCSRQGAPELLRTGLVSLDFWDSAQCLGQTAAPNTRSLHELQDQRPGINDHPTSSLTKCIWFSRDKPASSPN